MTNGRLCATTLPNMGIETLTIEAALAILERKNAFLKRLYDYQAEKQANREIVVSDEEFSEWMEDIEFRRRIDTFRRWQLQNLETRMEAIVHQRVQDSPAQQNASIQAANLLLRLWKPELFTGKRKADITINNLGPSQILFTLRQSVGRDSNPTTT